MPLTMVPLLMSLSARTIDTDGLISLSLFLPASPPMGSCGYTLFATPVVAHVVVAVLAVAVVNVVVDASL